LAEEYVAMRRLGRGHGKTITATTRQLESLIRLSEAHARMRLSQASMSTLFVRQLRLVRVALHQVRSTLLLSSGSPASPPLRLLQKPTTAQSDCTRSSSSSSSSSDRPTNQPGGNRSAHGHNRHGSPHHGRSATARERTSDLASATPSSSSSSPTPVRLSSSTASPPPSKWHLLEY